jgi:hypothetical protein
LLNNFHFQFCVKREDKDGPYFAIFQENHFFLLEKLALAPIRYAFKFTKYFVNFINFKMLDCMSSIADAAPVTLS